MNSAVTVPPLVVLGREEVRRHLTFEHCIPLMRETAMSLSRGDTRVLLRSVMALAQGHKFGIMPGALAEDGPFGAKLVGVFPENFARGLQSHQGVVTLFDPATGAPVCVAHAGEITRVRTAAASAVATDVLARPDAARLALIGYGEQAEAHLDAIAQVRRLSTVTVWGRSPERAKAFAEAAAARTGLRVETRPTAQAAVAEADIVCTVTNARDPVLEAAWLRPGTHVNAVGASTPDAAEIDNALVATGRLFADHRESALRQGGEIQRAKAAGLVDDECVRGELGEILLGRVPGRVATDDITVYKSLGNVTQDLASAVWLHTTALAQNFGARLAF
ncbi:MAG TPA: ornithine cyclodeaminase family protein [Aliidongia sp.]|nr:ornithine cyclodeaminase family protein [Aliidongia sp.]